MILYHGSNVSVEIPTVMPKYRTLDFGLGFYTTTNKMQAVSFAGKVMIRTKTNTQFVSVYDYDIEGSALELNILRFNAPNEEWLDFVFENRQGVYRGTQYDVVIGAVANDDVYQTFALYETNILTKEQTLETLKIKKLYDQIVFSTEKAFGYLKFVKVIDCWEAQSE